MSNGPHISIKGLTRHFGGLVAVSDFDLDVGRQQIMGLIGPNGAGKSTTLNMIGGTLKPSRGTIRFNGEEITRLPAHLKARRGIARVHQANILFGRFTALQNVLAGLHLQARFSLADAIFGRARMHGREQVLAEKARAILEFAGIAAWADERAVNLPHGIQRLLALALAMAAEPGLVLLDEPFTGMSAAEVNGMLSMIRKLRDTRQVTIIVIEHNLNAVMRLCDRIAVLNYGKKLAEGNPAEILADRAVAEAYLGA